MKKILLVFLLILLLAGECFAGGQIIIGKKKSAAASCTNPTGDELAEGFEGGSNACWGSGTAACIATWTSSIGSGMTLERTASPAGASEGTGCGYSIHFNLPNSPSVATWARWDRGSTINLATTNTDITLYIYIDDWTIPAYGDVIIASFGQHASDLSITPAYIYLYNDESANIGIRALGDSASTVQYLTKDAWHTIKLHFDTTAANSYLQVDGGATTYTFTRSASYTTARYMFYGGWSVGSGIALNMYVGYITINTP